MHKWIAKHLLCSWQWYHWLAYYCLLVGASFTMIGLGHLYDHRPFAWLGFVKEECPMAGLFTLIVYFLSRERPKSS